MKSSVQKVWSKVNKLVPCAVCKKPDWCTYTDDAICCMRVQSDRPMKNGGWCHRRGEDAPKYIPPERVDPPAINALEIWSDWFKATKHSKIKEFAHILGVEPLALMAIGCVWAEPHNSFAFPMLDPAGKIVGLRLRNEQGKKWAVTGSKVGCFFSRKLEKGRTLFVMEGPTDTAAGISMGLTAIGRPSCLGCESYIVEYVRLHKIREVVIVADNDAPGLRGAEKLQGELKVPSVIFIPPAKDLREFLKLGGSSELIQSILKNMVWTQPL